MAVNVVQQKRNNNKYYISTFIYKKYFFKENSILTPWKPHYLIHFLK